PRLRALLLSAHPARPCLLSPPRSPPLTALPSFPTRRSSDLDQGLPVPTVLPGFRSPLPHARGGRPPPRRAEKTSKVIAPPRKPQAGSGRRCFAACFQAATSPCAVRRMCSTSASGRYRADPIPKPVAPFCTHECRLAACTPPTGISSTSSGRTVRQAPIASSPT